MYNGPLYVPSPLADRNVPEDNEFELVQPERHAYDPLKDVATRKVTHKGGLGHARTEHY